jgi:hypothetical protein
VQADAEFRVFRNIVLYFTELATVKSWKYTIADGSPANADGYFDIAGLSKTRRASRSSPSPLGMRSNSPAGRSAKRCVSTYLWR